MTAEQKEKLRAWQVVATCYGFSVSLKDHELGPLIPKS